MKNLFVRFVCEENGQDLIEYSLLAGLISVAAFGIMSTVGTQVNSLFNKVSGDLTTAGATAPAGS